MMNLGRCQLADGHRTAYDTDRETDINNNFQDVNEQEKLIRAPKWGLRGR